MIVKGFQRNVYDVDIEELYRGKRVLPDSIREEGLNRPAKIARHSANEADKKVKCLNIKVPLQFNRERPETTRIMGCLTIRRLRVSAIEGASPPPCKETIEEARLPLCEEMMSHIFSFLDPYELSKIALISKRARAIASSLISSPAYYFPYLKELALSVRLINQDYRIKNRVGQFFDINQDDASILKGANEKCPRSVIEFYLIMNSFRDQLLKGSPEALNCRERLPTTAELSVCQNDRVLLAKKTQLCLGILFTSEALQVDVEFQRRGDPTRYATWSFNQAARFHLDPVVFKILKVREATIYSSGKHATLSVILAHPSRNEVFSILKEKKWSINNAGTCFNALHTFINNSFQPTDLEGEALQWLLENKAEPCESGNFSTRRLILTRGEDFKRKFLILSSDLSNKSTYFSEWYQSLKAAQPIVGATFSTKKQRSVRFYKL